MALPELPLLAVLPGTGGLTRLVDKRRVRRDHADFLCTASEGVRGPRALGVAAGGRTGSPLTVRTRQFQNGQRNNLPAEGAPSGERARASRLTSLAREVQRGQRGSYEHVRVEIDRQLGAAFFEVRRAGPVRRRETPTASGQRGSDSGP